MVKMTIELNNLYEVKNEQEIKENRSRDRLYKSG
jgi:hypothetical protein